MKVQHSRSVGLAALGCSMVLQSGNFVVSSAHVGCINTFLSDGWCDSGNNNEDCSYDEGDCCEDSCVSSTFVCGEKADYNCLDPKYKEDEHPHQSMSYTFSCDDDLVGNGDCDSENNVEDCDYDGGDCCKTSCVDNEYACGENGGYDCLDPDNQSMSYISTFSCVHDLEGNGDCDSDNNVKDCDYDGGDCCEGSCVDNDYVCGENPGYDCIDPDYMDDDYPSYNFEFSCDDDLAGNGNCDPDNNHDKCGYDGGDCCYCTCTDTDEYTCGGGSGYNCVDPDASCVNDEDGYVEAGYSTTVGVSANGYNAGHSGCGDDGCLPELTRDGDTDDLESRWSCASSLVPYGASCAITYTFKEQQHIRCVQVAFLKPGDHPRVVYISADGVDLGHLEASSDNTFNLFGVEEDEISSVTIMADDLTAAEFIDILEVRILVQVNHH